VPLDGSAKVTVGDYTRNYFAIAYHGNTHSPGADGLHHVGRMVSGRYDREVRASHG
jgi:hypothetical protein